MILRFGRRRPSKRASEAPEGPIRELPRDAVMGAILAGGRGQRMGGGKAVAPLAGQPLIAYPVARMQALLDDVIVIAKGDTELPELAGVEVWTEPEQPRHPLAGIVTALERSDRRRVLVCPCDMPLLTSDTLRRLAVDDRGTVSVARADGRWNPLVACYHPKALNYLAAELKRHPDRSLQFIVSGLDWVGVDVDPQELVNVNTPLELTQAAELLRASRT